MNRTRWAGFFIVLLSMGVVLSATAEEKARRPVIQLAILLDTSNSMDGLINQARSEIWKIVNEFTLARKGGQRPDIEVALFEYGNDSVKDEGFVRLVLPLTSDLDKVSEELFALTTNGGSEYCGQVIRAATNGLKWSQDKEALKVIVIAGNEPFTQGSVDYREACKEAIGKGILVNTIHCGSYDEGVEGRWKDGAMLADGRYLNIDQEKAVPHIDAPQDPEITRLGEEMNRTYIPYGSAGSAAAERQSVQDSNAAKMSVESAAQRAIFKSSANYQNTGWDLVDAVSDGSVALSDVKAEDLPEAMQKMSLEERKRHVDAQKKERARLQEQIRKLNDQRKEFVAQKMKELEKGGEETLDSAMIKAMREQAEKRNYRFE